MNIGVWKVGMAAPNDVSELARLIDTGEVDPAAIVALIGKTEGNGGANDFTRGYATLSYQLLLARHLRTTPDEIGKRVAFVWSGGTEGVLSPHATVFTQTSGGTADGSPRLAMGIGITTIRATSTMSRSRDRCSRRRRSPTPTAVVPRW
jgi:cyanuric acid amidohydrolase